MQDTQSLPSNKYMVNRPGIGPIMSKQGEMSSQW
jgi:hypothetical protein